MLLLDGQVHHDTHVIPMGNYVSEVGNYLSARPSDLGNYVSADTQPDKPTMSKYAEAAYFKLSYLLLRFAASVQ